jgi:hypothetical protein
VPSSAGAKVPKVPAGWVGVVASNTSLLTSSAFWSGETALMRRSHVQTVRLPVYWAALQPYASWSAVPPGAGLTDDGSARPTLLGPLDGLVLAAARQHLRVLPVVLRAPDWARTDPSNYASPPRDPAEFAALLTLLVDRYGSHGTLWAGNPTVPKLAITRWQIWNEPNLTGYWSQQPFAAGYVKLLKASRTAIRAADPHATVLLAGLPNDSWNALQTIYAAGGRGSFDAVAVHPYTKLVSNVVETVRRARKVMRTAGDGRKPIYLTEMGYASGGKRLRDQGYVTWNTTEAGQATQLRKLYLALAAKRRALMIGGAFWYSWYTPEGPADHSWDDFSGLRRGTGGVFVSKPALKAFAKVAKSIE